MPIDSIWRTIQSLMSLSRHFYPLEDVHAALRYSVCRSSPAESVFWCQELLWSGCHSEAVSTLFESWLWQVGPFRLAWLGSAWNTLATDEVTEDAIRLAAYQLGTLLPSQRDHSLWQILVLGVSTAIPEHVTRKTPVKLPSAEEHETYLVRAWYQGKARCAWWMALQLSPARVWELLSWYVTNIVSEQCHLMYALCLKALQNYEQLLGYRSEEYDIATQCVAVLMLCLSPSQGTESIRPMAIALDNRMAHQVGEWESLCGTRRARVYSLTTSCLYGTTWRGRHKWSQHNRDQLHNVERYLVGCPFWDEAISNYGAIHNGSIQWHSDDAMEAFYERYFPDDIPDEWTREEKQKSHGDGVLGPNETLALWKYATRFLSSPSRLTWGCIGQVQRCLREWCHKECHPSSILRDYSKRDNVAPMDKESLAPVRKLKRVEY